MQHLKILKKMNRFCNKTHKIKICQFYQKKTLKKFTIKNVKKKRKNQR